MTISDLQPGDNVGEPPNVLLGAARLEAPGGGAISPSGIEGQIQPGT